MNKSPCKNCKDRFFNGKSTCHKTCEKYQQFKTEREIINNKIKAESDSYAFTSAFSLRIKRGNRN